MCVTKDCTLSTDSASHALLTLDGTEGSAIATATLQHGVSVVPSVCITIAVEVAAASRATCW